jgi:hypothetical protein
MSTMPNGCGPSDTIHGEAPRVGEFVHPLLSLDDSSIGPASKHEPDDSSIGPASKHEPAFDSLFVPNRTADDEDDVEMKEYLALFIEFLQASHHATKEALLALEAVVRSQSDAGIVHSEDFHRCVFLLLPLRCSNPIFHDRPFPSSVRHCIFTFNMNRICSFASALTH